MLLKKEYNRKIYYIKNIMTYLSKELNLCFPYDWSNPNIKKEVFIHKVLEKAIFKDVVAIVIYYGSDVILDVFESNKDSYSNITHRIINNLKKAIELA